VRRARLEDPVRFVSIREVPEAPAILWDLLEEREPQQNISHRAMPSPEQHLAFVSRSPYRVWYLILAHNEWAGACYLTRQNEIGVFIFKAHRGKGYGKWAVKDMMRRFKGKRPFLANIAPGNTDSRKFFEGMGFRHVQDTLRCDSLS
jgi:RimJ/RimL family protein N-acetyltransferase